MLRRTLRMSLAAAALVPAVLYAQHPMPSKSATGKPAAKTSDAKKRADAMSAAPAQISKHATGPRPNNAWVVSPPHIMMLYQDLQMLDAFPTDPKSGGPWVMWKGTPYAHLMVPVSGTQLAKMRTSK